MKQKAALLILGWLKWWARWQLKKYAPDVVGITGSAGKTSCKNAVYAILKDKYHTKMTEKANSESGIPLDILGITPGDYSPLDWVRMVLLAPWKLVTNWQPYEKYVVEMGIDSPLPPKNMEYLLSIIRPRTAIWLNVLPVHTQFFPDGVAGIAREKGKLIASLPENGLAILNADDKRVSAYKTKTQAQVMTFGETKADVQLTDWQVSRVGTTFTFNDEKLVLPGYCLPKHMGLSLAAALCVGLDEDFTLAEGMALLQKNWILEPGRSSLIAGKNQSLIIDSSYNASPQTMLDMLALLQAVPGKRKLALLGDMRELGDDSLTQHKKVVAAALRTCERVYLVGPKMQGLGGMWYPSAQAAAKEITLQAGDVLLVKGSQNTLLLETAVEHLMRHPEQANQLLCRRGAYWDKQRKSV